MEVREKRIVKNSLIYAVGNLGSKVLAYVMVLVYTFYISAEELGYYDLILTTVSLLQPIIMLSFDEGIYRWLIDSKIQERKAIIASCIKMISGTTFVASLLFLAISSVVNIEYSIEIILFFFSGLLYQLLLNAVRGVMNTRLYAITGIYNSVLILLLEVICLIFLNMGIEALLIAKIVANLLSCVYLYLKEDEIKGFINYKFSKRIIGAMLAYTLPLIPNAVSWWIVNSSDRYIIVAFLGVSANGIYAIANKFPSIVTMFSKILYFSFQEAMIKSYNESDRDEFYSKIFRKYYLFMFSMIMVLIPITKFIVVYFVGTSYIDAWKYAGILYLGSIFHALSSFMGIGYQIAKDTRRSAISTVSSAVLNILINIILIKYIGLYAAALSTFLAYAFLFLVRVFHCRKYFRLTVKWSEFGVYFAVCILYIWGTYYENSMLLMILFGVASILFIYINRELLKPIYCKLLKK